MWKVWYLSLATRHFWKKGPPGITDRCLNLDNLGPHCCQHNTLHRAKLKNCQVKHPYTVKYILRKPGFIFFQIIYGMKSKRAADI